MEHISDILKQLQRITPDSAFTAKSRMLVLSTPKTERAMTKRTLGEWLLSGLTSRGTVFASFSAILVLSGIAYFQSKSPLYQARINIKNSETEELAIQIKLSELSAYEQGENASQLALRKAANNNPVDLSQGTLDNESSKIEDRAPINPDIDKVLKLML